MADAGGHTCTDFVQRNYDNLSKRFYVHAFVHISDPRPCITRLHMRILVHVHILLM